MQKQENISESPYQFHHNKIIWCWSIAAIALVNITSSRVGCGFHVVCLSRCDRGFEFLYRWWGRWWYFCRLGRSQEAEEGDLFHVSFQVLHAAVCRKRPHPLQLCEAVWTLLWNAAGKTVRHQFSYLGLAITAKTFYQTKIDNMNSFRTHGLCNITRIKEKQAGIYLGFLSMLSALVRLITKKTQHFLIFRGIFTQYLNSAFNAIM